MGKDGTIMHPLLSTTCSEQEVASENLDSSNIPTDTTHEYIDSHVGLLMFRDAATEEQFRNSFF
jgi:hypothetical protein